MFQSTALIILIPANVYLWLVDYKRRQGDVKETINQHSWCVKKTIYGFIKLLLVYFYISATLLNFFKTIRGTDKVGSQLQIKILHMAKCDTPEHSRTRTKCIKYTFLTNIFIHEMLYICQKKQETFSGRISF